MSDIDNQKTKYSVSVVVPFHNAEQTILQTLGTVYEALYKSNCIDEYEVIAVDDASTDSSHRLVSEQFPSVQVFSVNKRIYYLEAANKGMFRSRYDYVLLLTQGLFLPAGYFDDMMPHVARENVYMCSARLMGSGGQLSRRMLPVFGSGRIGMEPDVRDEGGASVMLQRGNLLMNREVMLSLGGYDTMFSAHKSADLELALRGWSYGYKSIFVDSVLCQIVEPSASSQDWDKSNEKGQEEWNEILTHFYYLHGLSLVKYRLTMNFYFLLSLVVPLSLFQRTRWALCKYIGNYNSILNERMWKYGHPKFSLQEIADYYFK